MRLYRSNRGYNSMGYRGHELRIFRYPKVTGGTGEYEFIMIPNDMIVRLLVNGGSGTLEVLQAWLGKIIAVNKKRLHKIKLVEREPSGDIEIEGGTQPVDEVVDWLTTQVLDLSDYQVGGLRSDILRSLSWR